MPFSDLFSLLLWDINLQKVPCFVPRDCWEEHKFFRFLCPTPASRQQSIYWRKFMFSAFFLAPIPAHPLRLSVSRSLKWGPWGPGSSTDLLREFSRNRQWQRERLWYCSKMASVCHQRCFYWNLDNENNQSSIGRAAASASLPCLKAAHIMETTSL